ncbi:MAG: CAP domain-containing protein [Actinomycetota bacterium]
MTLAGAAVAGSGVSAGAAAPAPIAVAAASKAGAISAPISGIAPTPTGDGLWRVTKTGRVYATGDALFLGSATGKHAPVVGIAATPSGHGYWLVGRDGSVWGFGDAVVAGSLAGRRISRPIVGIAAAARGYWVVADDGGVYAFGGAPNRGSTRNRTPRPRIVGIAANAYGSGYRLLARNGEVFGFASRFRGSLGGRKLPKPAAAIATNPRNDGYAVVLEDGTVTTFSSGFYGSATYTCPRATTIGLAYTDAAAGYFIGFANGRTDAYSPTHRPADCVLPLGERIKAMQRDLLERINQERAARGLAPLAWDGTLARYASAWSNSMAEYGFGHQNLGLLPITYRYTGENIASGDKGVTVGSLHAALMRSDGHRANMLAPGFTHIGIGVTCSSTGKIFITEDFSRPTFAGYPPPWAATPPAAPIVRSDAGSFSC